MQKLLTKCLKKLCEHLIVTRQTPTKLQAKEMLSRPLVFATGFSFLFFSQLRLVPLFPLLDRRKIAGRVVSRKAAIART